MTGPIVLAYSGSPSSSAAIAWLGDTGHGDVVTVTLDVGQDEHLEEIRRRALACGAARAHVVDGRDAFAAECVLPSLGAGALDAAGFPRIAALARPLIARTLVTTARIEGAAAVAHASVDDGIDALVTRLAPSLPTLAPAREWTLSTPAEYLRSRGLPAPPATGAIVKQNLWGRMVTVADCDDGVAPPWAYRLTRAPSDAPSSGAWLDIEFDNGQPTSVSGVAMGAAQLIESLSVIAGHHGIGRMVRREASPDGGERCVVYEAPAAVVLVAAHADGPPSGTVRFRLIQGRHTRVEPAAAGPVNVA
jgi:argininosuccinate synthase